LCSVCPKLKFHGTCGNLPRSHHIDEDDQHQFFETCSLQLFYLKKSGAFVETISCLWSQFCGDPNETLENNIVNLLLGNNIFCSEGRTTGEAAGDW
jgi:hypothetical protein